MLNQLTILNRTELGNQEMEHHHANLSRTERLLLFMVNGQYSVGEISNKLYSLPKSRVLETLDFLLHQHLVEVAQVRQTTIAPVLLNRAALEAYLQPTDLDPTTAMIANAEVEAALQIAKTVTPETAIPVQRRLTEAELRLQRLASAPEAIVTAPRETASAQPLPTQAARQTNTSRPIQTQSSAQPSIRQNVPSEPIRSSRRFSDTPKKRTPMAVWLALFLIAEVAILYYFFK